jgi:tetratricopeptide (TPR) repeat protein
LPAVNLFLLFGFILQSFPPAASQASPTPKTEQQFGTVHFPVSCTPEAQETFTRGVALLHSFAFESAENDFRKVLELDPKCAMAHWGIARSFWRWDVPDTPQLKKGWDEVSAGKALAPPTERERDYLNAMGKFFEHPEQDTDKRPEAYLQAMEQLCAKYPDDHEAAAFYAWALIASDDRSHKKRKQAAAILEKLFILEPNHPGVAHYLIHSYDTPAMAEKGLPAARRYALIAPAAPHALHMPSHIFARLGLWPEDIASNLASVAASRNAASSGISDEGHQYHAMEFLVYAYMQCGREDEAQKIIDEVRQLPQMKDMYGTGGDPRASALVAYPATVALELHDWKAAAVLETVDGVTLAESSATYLARGLGAVHLGNLPEARAEAQQIEKVRNEMERKDEHEFIKEVERDRQRLLAWIDHAEGRNGPAIKSLQEIAQNEGGAFAAEGELPAREMLGDMLLEMGEPARALAQYNAELRYVPNRFDSVYGAGRAAEAAKQNSKAAAYYRQLLRICADGTSQRPELAYARKFFAMNGN